MSELEILTRMVLAPWIYKATALIGKPRKIGGNQFRHNMATLTILIDYHQVDPVLLKASVIHDLLEEVPHTSLHELLSVDADAPQVVKLVQEVTRRHGESKLDYLKRLQNTGSVRAKILKCADRISNLTDLHWGIFNKGKIYQYLDETEEFVVPMAREVNPDMLTEITDLIHSRRKMLVQMSN